MLATPKLGKCRDNLVLLNLSQRSVRTIYNPNDYVATRLFYEIKNSGM